MTAGSMPESLRKAVGSDLNPVRPLPPAWRRTLVVGVIATAVVACSLAILPLRPDLDQIPLWLSWGSTLLELAAGVVLVGMALREAVPGNAVPAGAACLAAATGVCLQMLVGLATWAVSPGMPLGPDALHQGMGCLRHDCTVALPTFVVGLWLVFRSLPTRAPMAGLLGGAGAAITGDAVMHLLCPISDLRHVLVWHTGGVVVYMLLGWLAGKVWEAVRCRSY